MRKIAISSGVSAKEIEAINGRIVHYANVIKILALMQHMRFLTAFPLK